MYDGSLGAQSNRESFIATSPLIDENNEEVLLTDATLNVWICRQGCPSSALVSGSTSDGKITLINSDLAFQWSFTPEDMGGLCAGTYDVYLRVVIDDVTTQILACTIPVVEGGPAS